MNWWIFAWGIGISAFGFYCGWVMGADSFTPWRERRGRRR